MKLPLIVLIAAPVLLGACPAPPAARPSPRSQGNKKSDPGPRLVELATRLPNPTADDRVEAYDAVHGQLVSFPGHQSPPRRRPRISGPGRQPPPNIFPHKVWSAGVMPTGLSAFRPESELPAELAFGSYWARAAFSPGGDQLYLSGPFNTRAVYLSAVGKGGRLGPWRATTPMPPSPRGHRSLHQLLVARGRLYVMGGWYKDGVPGLRTIHAAPIRPDGTVGAFVLLSAKLPFAGLGFSLARCGDWIYVASARSIWRGQLQPDGTLAPFALAHEHTRLRHQNYGGTGLACSDRRLLLCDEQQTHVFEMDPAGGLRHQLSLPHPAPFARRTIFCHQRRFFVSTTHGGRIYRVLLQ